jgi:hypothetical protein
MFWCQRNGAAAFVIYSNYALTPRSLLLQLLLYNECEAGMTCTSRQLLLQLLQQLLTSFCCYNYCYNVCHNTAHAQATAREFEATLKQVGDLEPLVLEKELKKLLPTVIQRLFFATSFVTVLFETAHRCIMLRCASAVMCSYQRF